MKSLFFRSLLRVLLSFFLLIFLSFFISRSLSGDPVRKLVGGGDQIYAAEEESRLKNYIRLYREMEFDLPLFYVAVSGWSVPDSLKRIPDQRFKNLLIKTAYWSGNPEASYQWCSWYCSTINRTFDYNDPGDFALILDSVLYQSGLNASDSKRYKSKWLFLCDEHHSNQWKKFIPMIRFTLENQFHHWLFGNKMGKKGLLHGNLGTSWIRGMEVKSALAFPFLLTFSLVFVVLLFSFPVSLFIGAVMMKYSRSFLTKFFNSFFLFLYAVPTFWIGTVVLFFFANPNQINLFPSSAPGLVTNAGFNSWIYSVLTQLQHFILPALVLAYSTVVYLSQMTFELLNEELQKPYVTTLRAKGCTENSIIGIYAMKNVLVPVLVGLMSVFPVLIGGSVIIDFLFSLPGIGAVLAQACDQRDFPVVGGVLLLTGLVTVISFLITDMVTVRLDPRIDDHV